eukprot:g6366.t1
MKKLQHHYIVHLEEDFITHRKLHIVMELARGGTFHSLICDKVESKDNASADFAYFSEATVWDWSLQLILALGHMHKHKIIHRDVKPLNVMLARNENNARVKLGDFGISKVLKNNETKAHECVGTPYYLSPEMCEGKGYDGKADVWALGVTLYELISLQKPFVAKSITGLVYAICREPVPSLSDVDEGAVGNAFSSTLTDLIMRMLTKNEANRPTLAELRQLPVVQKRLAKWDSKDWTMTMKEGDMARHLGLSTKEDIVKSNYIPTARHIEVQLDDHLLQGLKARDWYSYGRVYEWGGEPVNEEKCTAAKIIPTFVHELLMNQSNDCMHNIVSISGSNGRKDTERHYCAVTAKGSLLLWGSNKYNQLGIKNSNNAQASPVLSNYFEEMNDVNVEAAACGACHTVIVTRSLVNDKTNVWVFGDWSNVKTNQNLNQPLRVSCLDTIVIKSVSCGEFFTAILTGNGDVLTFGFGGNGRLGHGDEENCFSPKRVDLQGTRAVSISCGLDYCLVSEASDGLVFGWGNNKHGQLGSTDEQILKKPMELIYFRDKKIHSVSAGPEHAAAVGCDGSVYTWGNSNNVSCKIQRVMTENLNHERIVEAGCGTSHTVVRCRTGAIYFWGDCGNASSSVPERIDYFDGARNVVVLSVAGEKTFVICKSRSHHLRNASKMLGHFIGKHKKNLKENK